MPPEALYGLSVSANMFPLLGVTPMLGRNILPEEDQPGRNREMILSYGLWARRFNSDRGIIGRSIEVNGHSSHYHWRDAARLRFPHAAGHLPCEPRLRHMDFWAPLGLDPAKEDRNSSSGAVARLRPGVSLQQAEQDVKSISERLARQLPDHQ